MSTNSIFICIRSYGYRSNLRSKWTQVQGKSFGCSNEEKQGTGKNLSEIFSRPVRQEKKTKSDFSGEKFGPHRKPVWGFFPRESASASAAKSLYFVFKHFSQFNPSWFFNEFHCLNYNFYDDIDYNFNITFQKRKIRNGLDKLQQLVKKLHLEKNLLR